MISIDHQRDVKAFGEVRANAGFADDEKLAQFAAKNLEFIRSHLDEAKALEAGDQNSH